MGLASHGSALSRIPWSSHTEVAGDERVRNHTSARGPRVRRLQRAV